jgi:hypothetical protein
MLAEICGWFTEGFETADLKDAKISARRVEPIVVRCDLENWKFFEIGVRTPPSPLGAFF